LENIKTIRRLLTNFGLHVTERAATELTELEDEFEKEAETAKLTVDQSNKLTEAMRDLQRTLLAETKGSVAYIVTDKRLDVKKLLPKSSDKDRIKYS
jgi:CO dehydrogenase/acetyl-CoA synthase beta subunit